MINLEFLEMFSGRRDLYMRMFEAEGPIQDSQEVRYKRPVEPNATEQVPQTEGEIESDQTLIDLDGSDEIQDLDDIID